MENNTVYNCSCSGAIPVTGQVDPELQKTVQATAQAVQESLNSFSDEVPSDTEVKKAKGFLNQFQEYIKSAGFHKDVEDVARKYNVPPKKVATNVFEKALGTVGDVLGIAIGTVCDVGHTLVNLLSSIAHGAVNIICKVANALARMVTLNKTCVAA